MKLIKIPAMLLVILCIGLLPASAAVTGHFERTLKVTGPVDLDIASGSGNITVRTGANDVVQISARIHANNSWLFGGSAEDRIRKIEQNPPVEQQGNSIHIGRLQDSDLQRNISIDYDVTVPAQTRLSSRTGSGDQNISGVQQPITAKAGSGNITLNNIGGDARVSSGSGDIKISSVKGTLNAEAGSGNIRAEGIAGSMSAHTGSGDVELEQVSAGDVRVSTGSGNVKLRGVKGGLNADTGSGEIHAEGEPTHDWRLGAGSGNITLRVPSQASFNIDARTSSGTLKVNHPVTMQGSFSKNHVIGKVGNGGVLLDVHTGSGDIYVD